MTESIQLSQFEFIRASGPDARTFLQGQVTCDTTQITPTQSVLGALCNLKGRVIADFRAAQVGEDIVLKVGTGLAEPVLAVLKKYAVFSKLTLSKDDELAVLGLLVRGKGESDAEDDAEDDAQSDTLPSGPHAVTSLGKGVLAIDAGCSDEGTRCVELWGNGPSIEASAALLTSSDARTPNKAVAVATISDWTRLEILSGVIHITPALSEEYTPAQLNYDISGVVNFKKGCYTGQEIVARMFYRSTPKKRLYPLRAEIPLASDAELNDSASETAIKPLAIAGNAMLALLDTDPSAREITLASEASVKLAVKEPDYFTK